MIKKSFFRVWFFVFGLRGGEGGGMVGVMSGRWWFSLLALDIFLIRFTIYYVYRGHYINYKIINSIKTEIPEIIIF